ncbi:MAG TPA: NAD(P)/FAD-dependent oxidoreductase [Thermomicrobiales bacterium]|nr:NAD(P)/FAD-dependent oxidoreductase [Thermomicrobiales bacterium]
MHISSTTPEYDVLIVGARVAGASLALLLAQRGCRVMLIDRDEFPSDTISTHYLGPYAVDLVRNLGVLEDVETTGFRRITRSRTWVSDCLLEGPIAPGDGYALAPRRDAFDSILIEHGTRHGVEFRERTRLDSLIEHDGRVVGAVIVPRGGSPTEVRASVVVGADGRHSKVADLVAAARYNETPGLRPVCFGYFQGLEPLPETAVELFFQDDRIAFVFPMQPGADCLALEYQTDDFAAFREDPLAALRQCFERLPGMTARLSGATLEGRMLGMRSIDNFFRVPFGPGWALIGDAGYLKDPITGMGMGDAMTQAFWLADALRDTFEGADWDTRMAAFQQQRDESSAPRLEFTLAAARMRDMPEESLAWLRAALSNPFAGRFSAHTLPAMLPDAYPEIARPMVAFAAEAFGAPRPEPAIAAADDDRSELLIHA